MTNEEKALEIMERCSSWCVKTRDGETLDTFITQALQEREDVLSVTVNALEYTANNIGFVLDGREQEHWRCIVYKALSKVAEMRG